MKKKFTFIPLLVAVAFSVSTNWTSVAYAQEDTSLEDAPKRDVYDLPTPVAIQGRTNKIDQGVSISVGYIPTDSFNRGFPLTGAYSFYFKPYFAWEVLSYSYNFNRETQLKDDFKNLGVGVQNIGFGGVIDYPRNIIMTGIVYTPLYSKSLLFNKTLVHSETGFYLGVGTLVFSQVGHLPTIAPGIQARYFVSPKSAVRIYLRQYFFNDTQLGLTGITDIGVGFETQFELLSRHAAGDE
ncbi:MAG: hypothetical protein IPJ84_04715 [Bdellovibrionales bacterium]|nr:hypothetical protein [Bdellovibrionales bacterium]